jgi:SnoaL-like protein
MAPRSDHARESCELPVAVPRAIKDYLRAFVARDLAGCTSCYGDDAVIQFQFSRYRGRDSIGAWHRERFDANLRLLRLEDVVAEQDEVTVDAVVASDRLAQWRFDAMSVRLVFHLDAGRIHELKCEMRVTPW